VYLEEETVDYNEKGLADWLVATRRDLHMHPELSHEEVETTARIKEILQGLDIDVHDLSGLTGAVGIIRGQGGGTLSP